MDTSLDRIMNGSITLEQPKEGYRVAIDPIFLAAAIPAQSGESILDVGCGVGAAMLCLARRLEDVFITGLELQPDYANLASRNIRANQFNNRLEVIKGDILVPLPRLTPSSFHHVMTNPPYFAAHKATASAHPGKALATVEKDVSLKQWIDFCLLMTRPKGTVSMIFPPDRLEEILPLFHSKAGEISIYPLWPGEQKPAKRLLLRARKNSQASTKIFPGMVLHSSQSKYSPAAEAVLRQCGAIDFS